MQTIKILTEIIKLAENWDINKLKSIRPQVALVTQLYDHPESYIITFTRKYLENKSGKIGKSLLF